MKTVIVYAVVGGVLASAGLNLYDWQLYVVLIALAVNYSLGVLEAS